MKHRFSKRRQSLVALASATCLSTVLLGGCSGGNAGLSPTPTSVEPNATVPLSAFAAPIPQHANLAFRTIYNFKGAPDGAIPEAGLTLVAGKFYGTTTSGGSDPYNAGTVYDVQEDGTEHVLHRFAFSPDGGDPKAGLTNLGNSSLYGTTSIGGDDRFGTVYEIKTDGTERVIHSFKCNLKDCSDGANPESDLAVLNDKLYGTTVSGGSDSKGTVFEVQTDGIERIVYSFAGAPDGDSPRSGLARLGGSLYGTTEFGGANNLGCVFEVDTDGKESVLYSFKGVGGSDGSSPIAGLTVLNGSLYGVTKSGGADDEGTVFVVQPDGNERVLYSFSKSNGIRPLAGLTKLKGLLYGTTIRGGAHDFGTVFELHPGGAYRVLHDFDGTDGSGPDATLTVAPGNALIGTTRRGGTANRGTVFLVSL